MKDFKDLDIEEREYVEDFYDDKSLPIEDFYENEFVICDGCGELTYRDHLSNNDFITSGGEFNICETCITNGYGR